MAELEAITAAKTAASAKPEVFGRRFPLPLDTPLKLGRSPDTADLAVPDDPMISGSSFHVTVTWDGTHLTVQEKEKPHKNRLRRLGEVTPPDAPAGRLDVPLGGSFQIGQTTFTLFADGEGMPSDPADGTLAWTADAARLATDAPFANPPVVLSALAELSQALRRPNEMARVKHMLKVAVDALPRADAAGLVVVPPDATPAAPKIGVREHYARSADHGVNPAGADAGKPQFAPSRKLVHQAVNDKKSLLHVWQPGAVGQPTVGPSGEQPTVAAFGPAGAAPWAVCAPLQQGTRSALYVSGFLRPGESPNQRAVADELVGYQKVVELMAGLLEVTRQTHRLSEEKARFWPFVPKPLRDHLADPDRATAVLTAREAEVVVLFCDLRNFTKYLMQENKPLEARWREVAFHLNMMSTAVTVNGGVVCRVLGDAIMGFWGWPDSAGPDEDRARAARAAAQILSGVDWFRRLQCGVGVAAGRAFVGKLGTEHLAEIDLYGPVVNLASRLQDMTKAFGVGVVVADEVAARLARDGGPARTRRLGRVRPKGMEEQPCEVHELLPEGPAGGRDWSEWNDLLDGFAAGRWGDVYGELSSFYGDDPIAQCLLRVMDRHGRKPPAGWDGAFTPAPPP